MTDAPLSPVLAPLRQALDRQSPLLGRAPLSAGAWLGAMLADQSDAPVVMVAPTSARAEALQREVIYFAQKLTPTLPIHVFPAWETLPFERLSPYGPLVGERLATLFRIAQMGGDGPLFSGDDAGRARALIITTPAALMQRLMPKKTLLAHGFALAVGDQMDLPRFREFLTRSGYLSVAQVSEPGEFAVRGGIIDFYPPGASEPVRVDLFGDEVERLRLFDPVTQRSLDPIPHIEALPVREALLTADAITRFRTNYREAFGGQAAEDEIYREISQGLPVPGMERYLPMFYDAADDFFDYLPAGSALLIEEASWEQVIEREREIIERHQIASESGPASRCPEQDALYLSQVELKERLARFSHLTLHPEAGEGENAGFHALPNFHDDEQAKESPGDILARVAKSIDSQARRGRRAVLAVRTVSQRERLRELLADHDILTNDADSWRDALTAPRGAVLLTLGDVAQSFSHPEAELALITEDAIFGERIRRRKVDRRYLDQLIASFSDLAEGDPVVHADHGVGRFGGLHTLKLGELQNEFLLIRYADDDRLYVPVEDLDQVGKHAGGEDVPLDKLGSKRWKRAKKRARKKILEMAQELVALQAQRESRPGFQYSGPDALYQEFAATFPYEETDDQGAAIEAVLGDMAGPRPMDRLVCGDVGFGKTEVALRAAFRAAMDGRQVAVLAPTTILAHQHYENFAKRLAGYPLKIGSLSRFRTPKEQKTVVDGLGRGEVDVVVGTHRLLQKDIKFKDLGLLVVDEEQRFGVTHKERIKQMRADVDILTLTATPIPRTLNMAMAGLRDISIIATPPADRLAIRTIVTHYDKQQVREAVLRELYRGGQVFYLHNQVSDIDKKAAELGELIPEARVGVAHGQMKESELERVMMAFYKQTFNILVCTTIIENGVDIPTANTIIIDRADKFGLAQLHQLRGRVGRSKHRAYAYLLVPHKRKISNDAEKRLAALESLGDLGAGFMLATHDLEIRGAGNILGDEQSGQIREVGFELYNQMLQEAVEALKAGKPLPKVDADDADESDDEQIHPVINLHMSTFIPEAYVPDVHQRLTLYKRIAEMHNADELGEMRAELEDRFGPLPPSVLNLLEVMQIKRQCVALKILKLEAGPKGGSIKFHPEPAIDTAKLLDMIRKGGGQNRFDAASHTLGLRNRDWSGERERLQGIREALAALAPNAPAKAPRKA
ncbi:transcription-repair coupling factor [Magnetofaba australis]|uniref:Transcription-repair-coupling factor n=1 Tax=Magnetofaba australis IT-1 TaxID=1434232 RepID=A0A1Y2K635_9PROT|nr:transcription-repair coupling factor [Magnetofaba australis]OSM05003.1 putative transcription-repair coupling factor [Magnetofaba australis IT-1]